MPNTIYTSEKVLPYVYMGVHKETGQFYFGFRGANKNPSTEDLGTKYFTSSKKVKELGFDNFNWTILAEFFEHEDAFAFEQQSISETFTSLDSLNKFSIILKKWSPVSSNNGMFGSKRVGEDNPFFGKKHSDESKAKMSKQRKGRTKENHPGVARMAKSKSGKKPSEETKIKYKLRPITKGFSGRNHSDESKAKMSKSRTGKKCPSQNVECPHCGKIGAKRNMTRYHFSNCKSLFVSC